MKTDPPDGKPKTYRLHGWDDEKVYYWSESEGDICVSDISDLMDQLEEVCRDFIENKLKQGGASGRQSTNEEKVSHDDRDDDSIAH